MLLLNAFTVSASGVFCSSKIGKTLLVFACNSATTGATAPNVRVVSPSNHLDNSAARAMVREKA
jgi:hypothetical protein